MAEPRPKSLRDGPTPRMRALELHVTAEATGHALPRRRFETVRGDDYYTYVDDALEVCRKASEAWRKAERVGKPIWLADIRCNLTEGLPHPLWLMHSKLLVAPKSNPVVHGDAAGASPRDEHWLYLIGYKPVGGAPIRACTPLQPIRYTETEVDGVLMALPVNEKERPDP